METWRSDSLDFLQTVFDSRRDTYVEFRHEDWDMTRTIAKAVYGEADDPTTNSKYAKDKEDHALKIQKVIDESIKP
jgi:hypothetical protein